jgi:outer membrane receptor protein involved in Fe transport
MKTITDYARNTLLLLILPLLLFGQSERGTILGTVKDSTGAVITGAKVSVTNTSTGLSVALTTNDVGEFVAPSLQVGVYSLRVEKEGFRPASISGITLNAAMTVRNDVTLELGTTTTAVEVQANALQLATENAKTSVAVTNKMVDELPLVVSGSLRSPFDLAALTPESKNLGGDNGFMLGGGQAASYGTNLDGISANTARALQQSWVATNAPSLEAITEFTVDSNGFKAEFGHAGGGVMNFVSKGGTNEFHGSAYEFLRNNAFDANNFFNNRAGISIPIYKQNDFGASFGGPILIPKIYSGKNKSFFFFSFEGFRNRAGATGFTQSVPAPEMLTGDFTNWVDASGKQRPIYDPTTQVRNADGSYTRTPFAGNRIPQSMFDPISVKALAAYTANGTLKPNTGAVPGTIGYVNNNYFVANGTNVNPNTKISVKGDHIFSEKHRISGYYGYNRRSMEPGPNGPPTLPGLYSNYNDLQQNSDVFRFSWDWTLSPTKLNHFYAGGNNWRENHDPPQATVKSGIDWKDKVCLGNVPDCGQNLLNLDFGDITGWGGRANNGSENTIYGYNDDFTWVRGSHTIKFGGQFQLTHYNGFGRQCVSGCASFSYLNTGVPNSNNPALGGSSFASFLLGYANGGQIDTIRFIGQQWPSYAGYVQDDWRVNSKLTVNYGLRWETQLPPTGLEDRWSDFSPTRPNPRAGNIPGALIYAGTGQGREGSRTLADSWFSGFGPRIGFAYQMKSNTVVRASYGRSFGAVTTVTGSTHFRGFTQTFGVPDQGTNGILPNMILKNGFPDYPIPPFIDPSFSNKDSMPWFQGQEATRLPEQNFWNLSIQRQLSGSTVLEVSYNGMVGSHLQTQLLNYNQLDPKLLSQYGYSLLNSLVTSPAAVAAGFRSPYPTFALSTCVSQDACWGSGATVARSLRPFPQYSGIDTYTGGGDHSGHSSYHAAIFRVERRYAKGVTLQASYVLSKILTDSDSYWGSGTAIDHFNRGLEKSIGQFDITHNVKISAIWELPFGRGKAMLNKGPAAAVLGNWRISGVAFYASGQPLPLGTSVGTPTVLFAAGNRPLISTYDGWRAPTKGGSFDPSVDRFVQPASFFPAQVGTQFAGTTQYFGNMTRYNPKFRQFPNYTENISLTKSIPIHESIRLDFRAEAFNVFNRVRFGTGSLQIQNQQFGILTSSGDLLNTPRQLQLALKLYF